MIIQYEEFKKKKIDRACNSRIINKEKEKKMAHIWEDWRFSWIRGLPNKWGQLQVRNKRHSFILFPFRKNNNNNLLLSKMGFFSKTSKWSSKSDI